MFENMDVDVLAGVPFMATNDISIPPLQALMTQYTRMNQLSLLPLTFKTI